jgi:hypothetical protein
MRIKRLVIGFAIATILTAYISGLTLSNQAFAVCIPFFGCISEPEKATGGYQGVSGEQLAGHKAQAPDILAHEPRP